MGRDMKHSPLIPISMELLSLHCPHTALQGEEQSSFFHVDNLIKGCVSQADNPLDKESLDRSGISKPKAFQHC